MKRHFTVVAATALLTGCPDNSNDGPPENPDSGPNVDAGAAAWRPVVEGLDGALLSIWGTSTRDVWTVGGPLGNDGFESLVLHFDGVSWRRMKPGRAESFWWVHGTSDTDVWFVGEKGRITHWDGGAFREDVSGTTATLFGVWAAAPNDAWAVGGLPDRAGTTNDVVLHWDGTSWKPEPLPQTNDAAFFKVWGSSKDDLYIVGELGIVWHRRGGTWKREGEGLAQGRLTTVAGCGPNQVFAVGGRDLLTSNGTTWTRADVTLVNDVNGVSCASGKAVVVGGGSLKLRFADGAWTNDFGEPPLVDLHGAWADETGAFWGVGGQFAAAARPGARRGGIVARYGTGIVPSALTQ